ncbi:MAG: hypothetical protein AB3N28_05630, partial [Kordiimonas sp.]
RICAHIALFVASTNERYFKAPPIVVVLATMRLTDPALFESAKLGNLDRADLYRYLKIDQWTDKDLQEWYQQWWDVALLPDDNLPAEEWVREIKSDLRRSHVPRDGLVSFVAKQIEGLNFVE